MAKTVNTFSKGLDYDTNFNKSSNETYMAQNVRVINNTSIGLNGVITGSPGNTEWIQFQTSNEYLIGVSEIGDYTAIISCYGTSPNLSNRLYLIPTIDFVATPHLNLVSYQIRDGKIGATGLFYNRLDNVLDTPVQIIPRNERPDLLKLYIIDGKSQMKIVNVVSPTIATQDPASFDMVYAVNFGVGGYAVDLTSGTLKAGRVQYTHQFYNVNGVETVFNPDFSQLVSITKSSESGNSTDYRGTPVGEVTNKGVRLTIFNYNSTSYNTYDRIRVVRVQYNVYGQPPTYTIIADTTATFPTTEIIDSGQDLGTLTQDEVNYLIRKITPKTIETKNNYLFLGNINEDSFDIDFDARAKRYDYLGNTYTGDFNPYNYLTNDSTNGSDVKTFQSNGSVTGGSGANISYSFITADVLIDNLGDKNTGNQLLTGVDRIPKSYFRDEIYRFVIVFFNGYGQSSFVKWIDDIRFPNTDFITYDSLSTNITAKYLYPQFTVNIPTDIHDSIDSFQILRCERTPSDRTVVACGIAGHLSKTGTTTLFQINTPTQYGYIRPFLADNSNTNISQRNILEFITPEYNFNNKTILQGTRLDIKRKVKTSIISDIDGGNSSYSVTKVREYDTTSPFYLNIANIYGRNCVDDNDNSITIDGITIKNNVNRGLTENVHAYKGSTPMIQLVDNFTSLNNVTPYCRLRQVTYPYGGPSLNAIEYNTFIPASRVVYLQDGVDSYTIDAQFGDCNINMFEYNRTIWEDKLDGTDNLGEVMFIPVETTIDLNYVVNPTINTLYNGGTTAAPYYAMHEIPGVYQLNNVDTLYTQDFSLYTYNSAYSQIFDSRIYISKPATYSSNKEYPTRIIRAEEKVNGESSDSWSKFYPNNFKDLDTKFNDLIALYTFNNQLFFFQEKAYGYLPVQEKSVTTTTDGQATVLGVGGVLDRFDYLNTGAGITHLRNLTSTQNALYFYDTNNNKICTWASQHKVLSDVLGVGTFINGNISGMINIASGVYAKTLPITLMSDYFRNEILISFGNIGKSLVYNELTNAFISVDTYGTLDYYKIGNSVFSTDFINNKPKLYKHDETAGQAPTYYGSSYPILINVIINPNGEIVNRYEVLTFTFGDYKCDTYRCYNSYQNSGSIATSDEDVFIQRFRNWRTNTIFDSDSENSRMKDTYLGLELTYSDTTNPFILHDIITTYTPLNLWNKNT